MVAAAHSASAKAMWQRPEYRAKLARLLPPMTHDQKKFYKKCRRSGGMDREQAIAAALAWTAQPDRKARICQCCGKKFRTRAPADIGKFCSRKCAITPLLQRRRARKGHDHA